MWDFPNDLPAGRPPGASRPAPGMHSRRAKQLPAAHLLSRKAVSLRLSASWVEADLRAPTA